ncbi:MAG: hypothetical protein PHG06_09605 [Parabacteroides sp.]|nr:hypothetical protein [Parabacteroides sp.]
MVGIGHIEPGKFVGLYAIRVKTGLMIFELSEYYNSQAEAWQALENDEPCHPPMFFNEWVTHQYLTDKTARVEKFEI